ncbi:hypothetical protein LQZ18_10910 [Lachnospiraceae bacterium ZAX-1]
MLLSSEKKAEEKKSVLEKEFGIAMSKEMAKEVSVMCNLSQGVLEIGIQKGEEIGIQKGEWEREKYNVPYKVDTLRRRHP